MNLQELEAIAERELLRHGLQDWSFGWVRTKRRQGACNYRQDVPQIQASAEFVRIPMSVCRTYVAVVSVCGRSSASAVNSTHNGASREVGSKMCRVPDGSSPHPEATGWRVALSLSAPLRTGLAIPLIRKPLAHSGHALPLAEIQHYQISNSRAASGTVNTRLVGLLSVAARKRQIFGSPRTNLIA